ncbi:MAG: uroporphyrinogen-III C-methyltransferase [Chitinophagales bacterium]|nr:uroporphyrinogen-III C-methyltransferase [Chitinophagales bacterium]
MSHTPKLILVGAGPGDPELITLKGLKAIRSAKVILFDALVSEELLDYAPASCIKKYVGKRYGEASLPQEEINRLIIEYALEYGEVVRLKGGDPFVFGRATEEIDFAESFGMETEIIPGLSSVTAVPAAAKIALTQRGVSRGFRVITATTSDEQLSENILCAAKCNETVVVLMGMNKLKVIAEVFSANGKDKLPVAVIQSGTTRSEKIILGRIDNIVSKVNEAQAGSPGIIVIGETVAWTAKKTSEAEAKLSQLISELTQA